MPSLAIQIDGARIATIDLAAMEVVGASVFGALDKEEKAVIDASGGNYSDGGCGYLIWIADRALRIDQTVTIQFVEAGDAADKGQTIQELFPDEEPGTQTDFSITEDMAAEMRARPLLHDAFTVNVETSNGKQAIASSDDLNTNFSVGVLWNWTRAEQARVYFRTYCTDDVLEKKIGTTHLEDILGYGDSARFKLVA